MIYGIAHIRDIYLRLSETFIYSYITNIRKYNSIIITNETENLNLFPFRNLYCMPKQQRYSWQWLLDRSCRRLLGRKLDDLYFKNIFKKEKVKILHAHFGYEGVRMLSVKKKNKLPLITTFYGFDLSSYAQQEKWRIAYRKLFIEGEIFLVEGSFMKKSLINLGCPPEKIKIVHIGVDTEKINFQERKLKDINEKIIILFCGRFLEKKGLIYALKAIRIIINKFPNLEFRILGDGRLGDEIISYIKRENMEKYVVLLGYQPHYVFFDEIKKAHILLQPSVTAQDGDSEGGAPTVLLEAQASGLPVVSTFHADIPEVVINGKSGFLVPERNVKELIKKLEYLIVNSDQWVEMGKNGRNHVVKNYNLYCEVNKLEKIYDHLIEKNIQSEN